MDGFGNFGFWAAGKACPRTLFVRPPWAFEKKRAGLTLSLAAFSKANPKNNQDLGLTHHISGDDHYLFGL
jgi:hypothetical protein